MKTWFYIIRSRGQHPVYACLNSKSYPEKISDGSKR